MTQASHEAGPGHRVLAGIAACLLALASLLWVEAGKLPTQQTAGLGPDAALRLVSGMLLLLAIGHSVAAVRQFLLAKEGYETRALTEHNLVSLGWVLAGLVGLILLLELGTGFMLGATWLFVATARAFGERISAKSLCIGASLAVAVFVFFSKVLTLTLPAGPLELLVIG